ncbi:elongation factor 4, partial [Candidatus Collierbacteria bacterium]|nr:elongation factor 4 [Candidatus Collierbacteria bacterium]
HIDAGKSTLADRFLEITATVEPRKMQAQLLDSNPIERERGITIKMAPVTMHYEQETKNYELNLIDTPGHVDFNYEVERALEACEGAILLIDATKGVQAQTVANYHLAKTLGLTLIPAINKIDASLADVSASTRQVKQLLGISDQPFLISAKTSAGVGSLLEAVIDRLPPPVTSTKSHLKALVFNSTYHPHLGVIAFVRIFSGSLDSKDKLKLLSTKVAFTPQEIGIFSPDRQPQMELQEGSVGYIITGLKNIRDVQVGDTISQDSSTVSPLPGFRKVKPNVYFDLFPTDNSRYQDLLDALDKLKLNDASLDTKAIKSPILGQGARVGFLGLLHAEVVGERLEREFDLSVITTSPSVEYQAILRSKQTISFTNPADFPLPETIEQTLEPLALVNVIVSAPYLGAVIKVCQDLRGELENMTYLDQLVELKYKIPLIEVITSLHDDLKSASAGFA